MDNVRSLIRHEGTKSKTQVVRLALNDQKTTSYAKIGGKEKNMGTDGTV